jgi:hypothetical protein
MALFLFGIGIFANAQDKSRPNPPKAPEPVKFTPPRIVKDVDKKTPLPPPPPPPLEKGKNVGQVPPPPPPLKSPIQPKKLKHAD